MAFCQVVALIALTTELLLVPPVGGKAMLSNEVHLGCPDLDLHRDAIIPHHHSVEGAIAIGFGVLDVVLEAACHWLPQVVHLQCSCTVQQMIAKITIMYIYIYVKCCLSRHVLKNDIHLIEQQCTTRILEDKAAQAGKRLEDAPEASITLEGELSIKDMKPLITTSPSCPLNCLTAIYPPSRNRAVEDR